MNTPLFLAFLALVGSGMSQFTGKIAGANRAYVPSFMLVQAGTYCLAAIVIHLVQRNPFDLSPKMTGVAAAGGIFAAICVFSMLLAFRLGGEGSVLFPIAGLGVIVAVTLSFLIYHEPITASKLFGFGFAAIAIIFLSR